MADFTKRKNQVISEEITPINELNYTPSRLVVHSHKADKAGQHFDMRYDFGDRAVSFATRHGLPSEPGKPVTFFRVSDHVPSYLGWSGTIEKGQYGSGKVEIAAEYPIVLKSSPDKISFTISSGDSKGRYSLIKQNDKEWLAIKKPEMERTWDERRKYKEVTDPAQVSNPFTTEKYDGSNNFMQVNKGGLSFTSARKSVDGNLIPKEDQVPHLRDLRLPDKYVGTILQGELWHSNGFNVLSGILNSLPPRAVQSQKDKGLIHFAPFRVYKGPHGEENLPYDQQYKFLQEMSKDLPYFFEPPKTTDRPAKEFHEEIGRRKGEGVVMVDLDTGENYKLKHRFDYDLRIAGFTEGTGRLKDKGIGAIKLEDKHGKDVGHVGTGLTDLMRQDMFKNPNKYIGQLVKVNSKKPLIGKVREPSLLGFTTDKNEADEVK